jgi:hypothetical protein
MSGSRDVGIGMVADMFGSTATTSSGLSGDTGKQGIGRGMAITGRGLGAAGVSKADQARNVGARPCDRRRGRRRNRFVNGRFANIPPAEPAAEAVASALGPRYRGRQRHPRGRSVALIGSISLGQVAVHTTVLEVVCSRCERADQYRLDMLIAQHGRGFGIPKLLRLMSEDCAKRHSVSAYDLCGVHCPSLSAFFLPAALREGE